MCNNREKSLRQGRQDKDVRNSSHASVSQPALVPFFRCNAIANFFCDLTPSFSPFSPCYRQGFHLYFMLSKIHRVRKPSERLSFL